MVKPKHQGEVFREAADNHAGNVRWLDALLPDRTQETFERRVGSAKSIGERNLHEARVEVADPLLQYRNAAHLLRAQRAPVKRLVERHDNVLRASAGLHAMHAVDAAGVHPLLLAIGSERYQPWEKRRPREILTIANHILGFNQASLAKYLFIVANEDNPNLDIQDIPKFFQILILFVKIYPSHLTKTLSLLYFSF